MHTLTVPLTEQDLEITSNFEPPPHDADDKEALEMVGRQLAELLSRATSRTFVHAVYRELHRIYG